MDNNHTYGNLSSYYYDLDAVHGAERELPFYRAYLERAHGPILEPMCGTGNFLIPFTKEGFALEGFDASHHMLKRLQEKAAAHGVKVYTRYGLLEELDYDNQYALIFIPNCSINLILDHAIVTRCLQNIYRALSQNGLFVCELLTNSVCSAIDSNTTLKSRALPDGSSITVETTTIRCDDDFLTSTHRYSHLRDTSITATEDESYTLKLYDPAAFLALLHSIGFTTITQTRLYHHGEKPHSDEDIIVFECRK